MKAALVIMGFALGLIIVLLVVVLSLLSKPQEINEEYKRFLIVYAETFQTCRPIIHTQVVICKPDKLVNYLHDDNCSVVSVVRLD